MRLSLWFLLLVLLGGLPAQALELTLKTVNTTESIQDNGPKDQDQRSGFIQYQGILDKTSDSPFAISLRLAETSTPKKAAKLSLEALPAKLGQEPDSAVLNLGLPSTITIEASSTMAPLEGPTVGALNYRGAAVDESDGRQEVQVDKDEVSASFGATPLTVTINPVKGQAAQFKFDQRQNIPLKSPVNSLEVIWNLALGAGDGIKLDNFTLKAEPAPSALDNAGTIGWAVAAGIAVLFFVIGFFTRRNR
ncbi:MAG: hypothetical protein WCA07_00450 [Gloeobacterales cyanobacterium]